MKKYQLSGLQAEIKENVSAARAFNPLIQAASGLERHRLRGEKAGFGYAARYLYLAYALLRGVPYKVVERKCGERNSPYASVIHGEAVRFDPTITLEACEAWISREDAPSQEVAA